MYLTYTEYTQFSGTLSEAEFNRFCFRAECEINNATFGRCKQLADNDIPEAVKRCMFELIEYLSENTNNGAVSNVQSFSNDGYSVAYVEKKTAQAQIYDIIYTYLSCTGLMYCGTDA